MHQTINFLVWCLWTKISQLMKALKISLLKICESKRSIAKVTIHQYDSHFQHHVQIAPVPIQLYQIYMSSVSLNLALQDSWTKKAPFRWNGFWRNWNAELRRISRDAEQCTYDGFHGIGLVWGSNVWNEFRRALFEDDLTLDDFDTAEFDSNAEFELLDPWENQFFELVNLIINCLRFIITL